MNDKMSNHENVTKITPRLSFPGGRCNVIYETRTSDINSITSNAERGSDLDRRRQSGPSSRWTNHRAKAFWCLTVCHWRAGREERVRIVTGGRGANQLNDRSDISISIMKHDQFLAEKKTLFDGIYGTARTQNGDAEEMVTAQLTWTLLCFVSLIFWMFERQRTG